MVTIDKVSVNSERTAAINELIKRWVKKDRQLTENLPAMPPVPDSKLVKELQAEDLSNY